MSGPTDSVVQLVNIPASVVTPPPANSLSYPVGYLEITPTGFSGQYTLSNLTGMIAPSTMLTNGQQLSGLLAEHPITGIAAYSGTTQSGATQLTGQTNVITSAGANYSVLLPAPIPGLEIDIINNTAYIISVFGTASDTINGCAASACVYQGPYSTVEYVCGSVTGSTGTWFTEGLGDGFAPAVQYPIFCESAANGLTALAGGGKPVSGTAACITTQTARFTTVGNTGGSTNDSTLLPPSVAGMELNVINSGANPLAVWSYGSDTVDGATYVTQMVNSMTIYTCPVAGTWVSNGIGTGYAGSFPTQSYANGITAYATGGQTNATVLAACINRVTTVANANDSVKLPVSNPGVSVTVTNAAASNSMNVFPQTGDAINALSANTALAIAAGKTTTFTCAVAGQWHCFAPA